MLKKIKTYLLGIIFIAALMITSKPVFAFEYEPETPIAVEEAMLRQLEQMAYDEAAFYYGVNDETLTLMAKLVHAEAGNQSLLGKRLVADVILNRVDDPRFGGNVVDVIYQPYQFSPVRNGALASAVPTGDDYEAVRLELIDRTNWDVLYFTAHAYVPGTTPVLIEGAHWFSK